MQNETRPEPQACCSVYVPNWQDRLRRIFFPNQEPAHWPETVPAEDGTPLTPRDGIISVCTTHFSFVDRLRILWTGRVETRVINATENMVGQYATAASSLPLPPQWMIRK